MKKIISFIGILTIFSIFSSNYLYSDYYRIFFKDKGSSEFSKGSPLYNQTLDLYNSKAIKRRAKMFDSDNLISIEDAPVFSAYINHFTDLEYEIKALSRWYNYIVIDLDSNLVDDFKKLSFIKTIEKANTGNITPQKIDIPNQQQSLIFKYENSLDFISAVNIDKVHQYGISGDSVIIGFCDTGFNINHNSFQSLKLLGQYDFIKNDSITQWQEADFEITESHGTSILSICAAKWNESYVGVAPNASYYLARTEDYNGEIHLEEDYLLEALEYFDINGVEIASISLGYRDFDSSQVSYKFEDLDGSTALSSKAVNKASEKGILCIVSNGNDGPGGKTLRSPADADSSISVGAVQILADNKFIIAKFSSLGPNAKGKIKPDISAPGFMLKSSEYSNPDTYNVSSGTSLAAPIVTGISALLLSKYPNLTPYEIKQMILKSGDRYNSPDNTYGHGVVDAMRAFHINNIFISKPIYYPLADNIRVVFYISSSSNILSSNIVLKDYNKKYKLYPGAIENQFFCDIPLSVISDSLAYKVEAENAFMRNIEPSDSFYYLHRDSLFIPEGIDYNSLPKEILLERYSNVYPSIIENSESQITLNLHKVNDSRIFYSIYNSLGQELIKEEVTSDLGIFSKSVNISKLESGKYYIIIQINNNKEVLSFSIIR